MSGLTNLTGLDLCSNQISDISALSGLTNLRWLYLANNKISDISVLSGLINLESLHLFRNQISDISALLDLTNLRILYLLDNPLSQDALCNDIPTLQGWVVNLYYEGECIIPPVPEGTPVSGMLVDGLLLLACTFGGVAALRKRKSG